MRIVYAVILCMLLSVSCNEKEGLSGPSEDNPLSEWVIPSQARAGGEAVIQWNGFNENARIFLAGNMEYEAEVSVVTASGLVFVVPVYVSSGDYSVILDQDGRTDMGLMEVLDAEMPVSDLKVPSGAQQGETVLITGVGFSEDCSIELIADGVTVSLEASLSPDGISFVVPEDMADADYELMLVQDGVSWLLTSSFSVKEVIVQVVKTLKRMDYYSQYIGSAMIRVSWDIVREAPSTLVVSEHVVDGDEVSLEAYDEYVMNEDGAFELVHDGFESSNDLGMSYVMDENGQVAVSDVLIYGDSETTPFTWTYDEDGFVTDIASPSRSFRAFGYTDGNLTLFRNTSFVYGDPSLVNNPFAPDVVWGYMALMEKNDPFVYVPYMMGWYSKSSALLPTVMISPSPTGTGTVDHMLSYDFDEDGYVVRMSWGTNKVEYFFE